VGSRAIILALLLTLMVGTAGCGGGDESSGTEDTTAVTQTETETGETETGTAETVTDGDTETNSSGRGSSGSGGSEAATASEPSVDRLLFRVGRNAVLCGLERISGRAWMTCYRPTTGYTLRLSLRGGLPRAGIVRRNRGLPPGVGELPVLRNGQRRNVSGYRCNVEDGIVRCRNRVGHGFQLGRSSSFRF